MEYQELLGTTIFPYDEGIDLLYALQEGNLIMTSNTNVYAYIMTNTDRKSELEGFRKVST